MDKPELIDRIINDARGIYPKGVIGHIIIGGNSEYLLCEEEFEQRAKELGWVNGYLWGKEYSTNGKKPDLDGDVIVQLRWPDSKLYSKPDTVKGWELYFHKCEAFLINDERFKPKQPESHSNSVDNSWHEKGEPPPVGVECEVIGEYGDDAYYKCCIVAHDRVGSVASAVFRIGNYKNVTNYYSSASAKWFRPLQTEREILIDIITSTDNLSEGMLADAILAAGFTNNKEK